LCPKQTDLVPGKGPSARVSPSAQLLLSDNDFSGSPQPTPTSLLDGRAGNVWARLLRCGRDRSGGGFLNAGYDAGDVVTVTRLDRLARSTRDLLNILAAITDKKAGFRSLGDTWADTTTPHGRLMLAVLGGLAEFERDLIRARTGEGRARAVAKGVKLGRKPKLTPHQQNEARQRVAAGNETLREIARSYNVHNSTISRLTA